LLCACSRESSHNAHLDIHNRFKYVVISSYIILCIPIYTTDSRKMKKHFFFIKYSGLFILFSKRNAYSIVLRKRIADRCIDHIGIHYDQVRQWSQGSFTRGPVANLMHRIVTNVLFVRSLGLVSLRRKPDSAVRKAFSAGSFVHRGLFSYVARVWNSKQENEKSARVSVP